MQTALDLHFEKIFPELRSRLKNLSRKFSDPEESFCEMAGSAWKNACSKFKRTGELLPASMLGHVAFKRHKSGRVFSGYSTKDAMGEQAFKIGRCRRIFLSELTASKANESLPDSVVKHITTMLSSREWDTPLERARIRIDWRAFSKTLPRKMRRLLICLVCGFSKTDASIRLHVSQGRISQMLKILGSRI